jgi:Na+-driven multidrug efflux pump
MAFVAAELSGHRRPRWSQVRAMATDGLRIGARTAAILAVFISGVAIAARIGPVELGAQQIANQLFFFVALALDALAIAGQVLVARARGEGDPVTAEALVRYLLRLSVWFGLGVGAVLIVASPVLPRLFTTDPDIAHTCIALIVILGAMQVPAALAFTLDGVLMGMSGFRWLQRSAFAGLLAFAPIALLVQQRPSIGLLPLWLAMVVWISARAWVNHIGWRRLSALDTASSA